MSIILPSFLNICLLREIGHFPCAISFVECIMSGTPQIAFLPYARKNIFDIDKHPVKSPFCRIKNTRQRLAIGPPILFYFCSREDFRFTHGLLILCKFLAQANNSMTLSISIWMGSKLYLVCTLSQRVLEAKPIIHTHLTNYKIFYNY